MKIKKIEALLKKSKCIQLVEAEGNRWLGNGEAFYLATDIPEMTKDEILSLYDVPEDKRWEFSFEKVNSIPDVSIKDYERIEYQLTNSEFSICHAKKLYMPLQTVSGIDFISVDYLKPFTDKDKNYSIFRREFPNGNTYFAIKKGLFLVGIVMAHRFSSDKFRLWVNNLANNLNNEAKIESEYNNQITLFKEGEER